MQRHTPRKRFGQNFLVDPVIIATIVAAIHPQRGEHILEIGPGQGALTAPLLASQAQIDAVEIDRDLAKMLTAKYAAHQNFTLHCEDILQFSLRSLNANKLRVIGNLPYNISTPLLFKLFDDLEIISDMYFMLQREVAMRLIAQPGTKDYGRLSIMAQYYCNTQLICDVPSHAFDPAPKVQSNVIRMQPRIHTSNDKVDTKLLQKIVTLAFNQRRKTIANSLQSLITALELQQLEIAPTLRAENLTVTDYLRLTHYLEDKNN